MSTLQTTNSGLDRLVEMSRGTNADSVQLEIIRQIADIHIRSLEIQVKTEDLRQSQERFDWEKQDRQAKTAFEEAFARFKAKAPKIEKTERVFFEGKGDKPNTLYYHVNLAKACDLLYPVLLHEGITVRWKAEDLPALHTRMTCYLGHTANGLSYEHRGSSMAGPADTSGGKNPIQGMGSSSSYLERYTFLQTVGIIGADMDNDGQDPGMSPEDADKYIGPINAAQTPAETMKAWRESTAQVAKADPKNEKAKNMLYEARDARLLHLKEVK